MAPPYAGAHIESRFVRTIQAKSTLAGYQAKIGHELTWTFEPANVADLGDKDNSDNQIYPMQSLKRAHHRGQ
jgi:hypothetical protein